MSTKTVTPAAAAKAAAREALARTVDCPWCTAHVGQQCKNIGSPMEKAHVRRVVRAKERAEA